MAEITTRQTCQSARRQAHSVLMQLPWVHLLQPVARIPFRLVWRLPHRRLSALRWDAALSHQRLAALRQETRRRQLARDRRLTEWGPSHQLTASQVVTCAPPTLQTRELPHTERRQLPLPLTRVRLATERKLLERRQTLLLAVLREQPERTDALQLDKTLKPLELTQTPPTERPAEQLASTHATRLVATASRLELIDASL